MSTGTVHLSPDEIVFWSTQIKVAGYTIPLNLNMTIAGMWIIMGIITFGAWLATRNFSADFKMSKWQNLMEVLVLGLRDQIKDIYPENPGHFVVFIGTFFIFILVSNLSHLIPIPIYDPVTQHWGHYMPPTGSLSTTVGFTLMVFVMAYIQGMRHNGPLKYWLGYFQPNIFMMPFNFLGQIASFLTLSLRLYGNIMGGGVIAVILMILVPFLFPVIMNAFHVLIGVIQAYIFSVLAMAYIASAIHGGGH